MLVSQWTCKYLTVSLNAAKDWEKSSWKRVCGVSCHCALFLNPPWGVPTFSALLLTLGSGKVGRKEDDREELDFQFDEEIVTPKHNRYKINFWRLLFSMTFFHSVLRIQLYQSGKWFCWFALSPIDSQSVLQFIPKQIFLCSTQLISTAKKKEPNHPLRPPFKNSLLLLLKPSS